LVDKFSLGIGGHINPLTDRELNKMVHALPHEMTDALLEHTIIEHSMLRELHEEVAIGAFTFKPLGFINEDTTDVGKHHLGVLYLVELEEPTIASKEKDKIEGNLVTIQELKEMKGEPEGWSQVVFQRIKQGFI
jgi:predicted NUDIX family phosphoesterase